ncbi:chemotaxis protein CheB [Stenotrophomonas sp. SY1]|uniref:chemotaxis protein CheB n=1 Tax=Stenotrophomonas sp. SY1 TaxID=477235 RepID=UPI001E51E398|nr:chemotaxis protein CheB [Stenotrophomonas sp. SY1]
MSTICWGLHVYVNDDVAKPVALLARAGVARDRLREALVAAGARIVLEEDPNQLEVGVLQAASPQVVLVALEPAVEDALERLEPVLEAPQLSLMFEEAELAARREGWEAQRWVRHMAAKLQGHDNVLPPGSESEAVRAPVAPEPVPEAVLETVEVEAEANDVAPNFHVYDSQAWNDEPAGEALNAEVAAPVVRDEAEVLSFEELIAGSARTESRDRAVPPPLPEQVAGPATQLPAAPDFSEWSLVEDDGYVSAAQVEPAAVEESALDSLLNSSLTLMEIEGEGATEADGAVLLIAGIGGPDAVRRILAGLPEDFARPVLVQLRLDGGRYANLVKQMARATTLPVSLADPGQALQAGNIYILPDVIGVEASPQGLLFSEASGNLLSALAPARSAVLMLSGADTTMVEQVLEFAGRGGWVAGQVGEGCYDPAAASQLAVAGMSAGDPEYLAAELAVHCAA